MEEGKQILDVYSDVCENHMALYGMIGKKTDNEKFAGGVASWKIHYILPSGRVIEGPCFHHDGQNFSKVYDIKFLDEAGKEKYAWQNTYAISTRMLGTMFAIHSDNKGLVLPPKLAENKIVIIPILFDKLKEKTIKLSEKIEKELKEFGPILDKREDYSPGRKFSEWELKGIPLRIEIGPKDLEKKQVTIVKRNDSKKLFVKLTALKKEVPKLLNEIQEELYKNAEKLLNSNIEKTENKKDFLKFMKEKKVVIVPMCYSERCEEKLKEETEGAKTLFLDPKATSLNGEKCIICGKLAEYFVYTGKTY
jgi:prolyl-tRNA synthetase